MEAETARFLGFSRRTSWYSVTESICPLLGNEDLSTQDLMADGWGVSLKPTIPKITHPKSGASILVKTIGELPLVEFRIQDSGKMSRKRNVNLALEKQDEFKDDEAKEDLPLETMLDTPVGQRRGLRRLKINAALDIHRRIGHLQIQGNEVECSECVGS